MLPTCYIVRRNAPTDRVTRHRRKVVAMTLYGPVVDVPDLRYVARGFAAGVSVLESSHKAGYFIGNEEGLGFEGLLLRCLRRRASSLCRVHPACPAPFSFRVPSRLGRGADDLYFHPSCVHPCRHGKAMLEGMAPWGVRSRRACRVACAGPCACRVEEVLGRGRWGVDLADTPLSREANQVPPGPEGPS